MSEVPSKRCPKCTETKELTSEFWPHNKNRKDGFDGQCKLCGQRRVAAHAAKNRAAAEARLASQYASLGAGNYKPINAGTTDAPAHGLKQQEFTEEMGAVKDALRAGVDAPAAPRLGSFIANLAEDEHRFEGRRLSRSISLSVARDELSLRRFNEAAAFHFKDKIQPSGEALKPVSTKPLKRVVNILLSDLHFGAELVRTDNPTPYTALEESRRFGKIIGEVCDFKPQYRSDSVLNVYLNGDLIEGYLLHDLRDGAPLTEQCVAFWKYLGAALQAWSAAYLRVNVECQPGNHGRNRLRHPGRATSSKWDGEETKLAIGLSMMCSGLPNVTFRGCGFDHRMAVSTVELPGGSKLCLTHSDTEIKLGDPDTKAAQNFSELANINATQRYGTAYDVFAFGHFHKGRLQMYQGFSVIWNAPLVPPNGHARSSGYARERCGQWLWESVAGHPVGDLRFLEVGPGEDRDASLNRLCPAFRFEP